MADSPLSGGATRAPATAPGRDNRALGPSDNSDSGSDVAGIAGHEDGDPTLPVDKAMDDRQVHPDASEETIGEGVDSDAAGSGERKSAAGDGPLDDAPDVGTDRVFSIAGGNSDDLPVDDETFESDETPPDEEDDDR